MLVLVDGVRQGTDTGHLNSTFLDPALIKRIEVVRGPSALLYGSGALGGVIAYETANASDLLGAGKNSGYRVFGTAATGDHSLGMGASTYGRSDTLDGLLSGPAVTGVTSVRVTAPPRRTTKRLIICWRKAAGKLTTPRRWPAHCAITTTMHGNLKTRRPVTRTAAIQ